MSARNRDARAAEFSLASFLPFKLGVISDSLIRIFSESYQDNYNLTIAEWRVLAIIAQYGTLSPTVIGRRAAMDKVKVSRASQSLVTKGLLRQSQDPNDGRGRLLRMTRKGAATHDGMVPLVMSLEATFFSDLSRADLALLNRLVTKITTRLETIATTGPAD
jgi:DNA-binding MarR family transcriptional regulator